MRSSVTIIISAWLVLSIAFDAQAQDPREDVVWVRSAPNTDFVLDGELKEPAWDKAEKIELRYGEGVVNFSDGGEPGSGWRPIGGFSATETPVDPADATIRFLAQGDQLWMSVEARDESVGGLTSIFRADGVHFMILDRTAFEPWAGGWDTRPGNTAEHFYTWWNPADTTDEGEPMPGIEPRFFGGGPNPLGSGFSEGLVERTEEQIQRWNAATTVQGTANDDTHGSDAGYVMEHRIDLSEKGYDIDQPGGEAVLFAITLGDADFFWPVDETKDFLSFTWWQNQWGNNWNEGTAVLLFDPDVTVDTAELPEVEPDFVIPSGENFSAPTIDGRLDEPVWNTIEDGLPLKFGDTSIREEHPGPVGGWQTGWFRSDLNDREPTLLDVSEAEIKWFYRGDTLYLGVDVSDQAINGIIAEDGRDGIRFGINARDTVQTDMTPVVREFDVVVDSAGTDTLLNYAAALNDPLGPDFDPDAIDAAVFLKGSSTAADPTDVDEGYQIEVAIHLPSALGYADDLGDRLVYLSANFFDGDAFEDFAQDYATRTWFRRERGTNDAKGTGAIGYLAPDVLLGTGVEESTAELPTRVILHGNYPNPFNPSTTVRYSLPAMADVEIQVFDVLGRQVATFEAGMQAAGRHEYKMDASRLASGVYMYQVQAHDQTTGSELASSVGRMVLVK